MASTPAARSLTEFETQRGRLFGLAYRLLGSAAEAEDAVQDTYLRWSNAAEIENPPAWLAKVITNLCLNRLTSARVRRERYVGPWLPEPVLTENGALGPLETVEQRDSVSLAMLVLLERLTPSERAVFVLREAFGYGYREIAETVDLTEPNCRQLYRRASQRLTEPRARFHATPQRRADLAERFLTAAQGGDLEALETLLAQDVVSWADGGGEVSTARRPIEGRARVARYLAGGFRMVPGTLTFRFAEVNGGPAVLAAAEGTVLGVMALTIEDDRISALHIMGNPAKLAYLSEQLSRMTGLPGS
ncbi:RNA polymerase sigma-70 factor [Actinophytocola xanthii]|uniref:RNA polymerase subunit sigma-24 n=1 Tax=Actinophytocola xanthii TaxID=1912961 RepID=A0A1Q8C7R3_9PSEU|nr:RNA polymerase sigma-70 factor [Actinophytocola xanthii]OLF10390.1 RNA polymerase subunit sigma-24 [Actinophytocola xanthii]